MPVVGFGAFVMLRRQLLGIRARVEHAEPWRPKVEPVDTKATPLVETNGKGDGQAPETVVASAG